MRLLTNLETDTQKLLQVVLIGQPELREALAKPELRQLAQRITAPSTSRPCPPRKPATTCGIASASPAAAISR